MNKPPVNTPELQALDMYWRERHADVIAELVALRATLRHLGLDPDDLPNPEVPKAHDATTTL